MNTNQTMPKFTIDQLLTLFGFSSFSTITFQFVIPSIAACGLILCLLNAWIFFTRNKETFSLAFYDFYKLITIVNIFNLCLAIPYGFCFTPLYVPNTNGYMCRVFTITYACLAQFFLYFTGVLEIAALLERMRMFSLIVEKYYTLSPKLMCLLLFVVCVAVDMFYAFNYVVGQGFDFYEDNVLKGTFYIAAPSEVAQSPIGSKALIVLYFVRDFFTLIVGLVLNCVSLIQLRAFLVKKSKLRDIFQQQPPKTTTQTEAQTTVNDNRRVTRDLDKKASRNSLYMVVTLCFVSILSRLTLIITNTYFLFRNDGFTLILVTLTDLVIVLGPSLSFFIFYMFNKIFRKEVKRMILKKNAPDLTTSSGSTSASGRGGVAHVQARVI